LTHIRPVIEIAPIRQTVDMPSSVPPKPNTQALSWFFGEEKNGTLQLTPHYQRNPIWSLGQKCFLIDSLLSGAPIPQVFVNIKTEGVGRERQTIYEIVDGQQRLRAILEFMNDEYELVATAAKAYPVSEIYKPHIGKKYSQLPPSLQDAIWNYPLAVQELRGWDDIQIRALFRRLNYVVERLSKQELRHSQYFGEFVDAVEALATEEFWDEVNFFTRKESQRMKDVEFISELLVVLIDGIQEGQSTLDRFYADYDVVFQRKSTYLAKFRQVLKSISTLRPYFDESRFRKKADFYGLFAAAAQLNQHSRVPANLAAAVKRLQTLERLLEGPRENFTGRVAAYYSTVVEGPNKRAKRDERTMILQQLLSE
jgi:hypothetical protein